MKHFGVGSGYTSFRGTLWTADHNSLTGRNQALLWPHESPSGGCGQVKLPFGQKAGRTRRERDEQLQSIFDRLDTLETAPAPTISPSDVEATRLEGRIHLEQRLGPLESRIDGVESALGDMERKVKEWTFAVEEGIERVSRSERRVIASIKRARKELSDAGFESPSLEAEAEELRIVDGKGSDGRRLPEVQPDMGEPDREASSIRGVSAAELNRVRGF